MDNVTKIVSKGDSRKNRNPKVGDLFVGKSPESDEDIFILAEYDGVDDTVYAAISIIDGNIWNDWDEDIEGAVRGLTFLGDGCIVSVESTLPVE